MPSSDEPVEVTEASVTLSVPPWSMSTAWPVPAIETLEMVSVPTVPPPSSMPSAAALVVLMLKPDSVLFWASSTPSSAPVTWMVGIRPPDPTSMVTPLTTRFWPWPTSVCPLARLMPLASL